MIFSEESKELLETFIYYFIGKYLNKIFNKTKIYKN